MVDSKSVNSINYCIVDGGMHQITYYGQLVGIRNPIVNKLTDNSEEQEQKYTICGCMCSTHDILAKNIVLPILKEGDILCFEKCGAYSATECYALFLSRSVPMVVIRDKDVIRNIRSEADMYMYNMEG